MILIPSCLHAHQQRKNHHWKVQKIVGDFFEVPGEHLMSGVKIKREKPHPKRDYFDYEKFIIHYFKVECRRSSIHTLFSLLLTKNTLSHLLNINNEVMK